MAGHGNTPKESSDCTAFSYQLPAASYQLSATSCQLPADEK